LYSSVGNVEMRVCLVAQPSLPVTLPPKTPLSASENINFSFLNTDKSKSQKQTLTNNEVKLTSTEDKVATQNEKAPSIFGGFNGGLKSSVFDSSTPSGHTNGTLFGGGSSGLKSQTSAGFSFPGFGSASTATTPAKGFSFTTTAATTTVNTPTNFTFGTSAAPIGKSLFSNASNCTFADLAKQSLSSNTDGKATGNGSEQRGLHRFIDVLF
jgi:hypothetical protein